MPSQLSIGILIPSTALAHQVRQYLAGERYSLYWSESVDDFLHWLTTHQTHVDCLLLENSEALPELLNQLQRQALLLPTLILVDGTPPPLGEEGIAFISAVPSSRNADPSQGSLAAEGAMTISHPVVTLLSPADLDCLDSHIEQAIGYFLRLPSPEESPEASPAEVDNPLIRPLSEQQKRLAEKLKERLGYLGVYYKRNPQHFFRNMTRTEQEEFLEKLRLDYRDIILNYFSKENNLNQKIDDYVNIAFFADISVSQIVEVHMELIDEFAKQLKLEGRSEEILLDYRLTLIDVIAHLCEMYRRSIPREM